MTELDHAPIAKLAEPLLAPLRVAPAVAASAGLLLVAMAGGLIWLAAPGAPTVAAHIPASAADLGDRIVTFIDPADRAAVAAATSTLRLAEPVRRQIEQSVLDRQRRLGWIVLTDSMDPDGDTVAVEASGIVQHVVLSKVWVPVAVPLEGASPIAITAVRDGGGGGVTVALATRSGPVTLRIMLPGERVEVMP
jgi:hypothetical protein